MTKSLGGGQQADDSFHHRSSLKKSNKPFKGKSKGKAQRKYGQGRVNQQNHTANTLSSASSTTLPKSTIKTLTHQHDLSQHKYNRHNSNKLKQQQKRASLIHIKRIGNTKLGPPKMIALIALSHHINTQYIMDELYRYSDEMNINPHTRKEQNGKFT